MLLSTQRQSCARSLHSSQRSRFLAGLTQTAAAKWAGAQSSHFEVGVQLAKLLCERLVSARCLWFQRCCCRIHTIDPTTVSLVATGPSCAATDLSSFGRARHVHLQLPG